MMLRNIGDSAPRSRALDHHASATGEAVQHCVGDIGHAEAIACWRSCPLNGLGKRIERARERPTRYASRSDLMTAVADPAASRTTGLPSRPAQDQAALPLPPAAVAQRRWQEVRRKNWIRHMNQTERTLPRACTDEVGRNDPFQQQRMHARQSRCFETPRTPHGP
jgi:hypothetical protein